MKQKIDRYLKILQIELEDLECDILDAEEALKKKFKDREITDYVFMENLAAFKAELSGIQKMEKEIESLSDKFDDLDSLCSFIDGFVREKVEDANLPEAVYFLIKRKLDKIYLYTRQI